MLKRQQFHSARSKRRHPYEKRDWFSQLLHNLLRRSLDHRFWAKHQEPFAKQGRGLSRRKERLFVRRTQHTIEE